MTAQNYISDMEYGQYNDYYFKSVLHKRTNGLLKFIKIPYKVKKILLSELTNIGPNIHRMDFAGEADVENDTLCIILECQTNLPNEDDITRFFQYVSSLRVFKNSKVELYILCTRKAPYAKKEFIINDECIYTMHMISLKDYKATEIFNNIENKLKNNEKITDEDIASLQVIVYTDYYETKLEILLKARKLIERVADSLNMDINEKRAIIYLLDVLSTNMLNEDEHEQYIGETKMLINPVERYMKNEGIKEGKKEGIKEGKKEGIKEGIKEGKIEFAQEMIKEGFSIDYVTKLSGLSKEDILKKPAK